MNGEHAEIARRLDRVEHKIDERVVTRELLDARMKSLEKGLEKLEESQRWALRLIITQVVVMVGGLGTAAILMGIT